MEASAAFATLSAVGGSAADARTATHLLSFGQFHSGMIQPWAVGEETTDDRRWVASGDAFGLVSCMYQEELAYRDGDARGLLAAIATAGLLRSDRWHSTIATSVLGNLRMTSRSGFGPSSKDFKDMVGKDMSPGSGWRELYDSDSEPQFSPHYQSWVWAVFLWASSHAKFDELQLRATAAITTMMEHYPASWIPTKNGIAVQRARILLPLAWLVRVNDTALHRSWLQTAVDGLLTRQYCEATAGWCAIREELSHPDWGGATRVPTNEDYGTFEAPLNQEDTDPVSDLLYTNNFALLGLHEAAAVLGNATILEAEERLASYVVRLQARSTEHPELSGAFFRAFDFKKWESWASDADIGWGAWAVESGWSQSWLTITLGLRQLNTTLWEVGQSLDGIGEELDGWTDIMFPGDPQPSVAVKTDDTAGTFSNPLCGLGCDTADPWIQMVGNATHHTYYWVYTSMPPLKMRKAATLAGLHSAPPVAVWSGPSHRGFWAPELHYWPAPHKTWFIYVVNNNNRSRIQVLRSTSGEPDGPFEDKGFVGVPAIDPNVLHHPSGKKYLLVKGDRMWLTELQSPWATTGPSLELPLLKCPLAGNQWYEAPATWVQAGKIWLMYSRCNTGPNYRMNLAYCDVRDDLMQAGSWRHFNGGKPVIVGNGGDDRGPGHNGWFSSPTGSETWIVYHGTAANESARSSRAMRIPFNGSGWPVVPRPPPLGARLAEPR